MLCSNIVRVDNASKRMHGYYANVTIDRQTFRTYYSDRRFGGVEGARRAAEEAVAQQWQERELYLALKRRHNRRANSPGDIPGVNRWPCDADDQSGYWFARWHDSKGQRRSRKFSVKRYGERLAYELALDARLRATETERGLLRSMRANFASFELQRN